MRFVQALDRCRRVTAVPYQNSSVRAAAGLSINQCKAAAWAYTPDGWLYRGAGALNAAVAVALGTRLPLRLYFAPGIRRLQDHVYYLVQRNRSRLPGDTPYCQQHPEECVSASPGRES